MNRIFLLIWSLLYTVIVTGQQDVEYLIKARALVESGNPDKAIDLLSNQLEGKKNDRLYIERANAYVSKGDFSSAISDYNTASSIAPLSGEYGLSRAYALMGASSTAIYHLENTVNSIYKRSEKEIKLDKAFQKIETSQEWRKFWKEEHYSLLERNISEIEYYNSVGKTDESNLLLSEIKQSYKNTDEVVYAESLINFTMGKYTDVINSISKILDKDTDNEKYLRVLAKAQTELHNYAGASQTYTKLINLNIPDAELFTLRAECYIKTGEADRALNDIVKYLEFYPQSKKALSMAGKAEIRADNNIKALEYFSENLKIHPNDPDCFNDRGNALLASKSWDWAVKDYSMALDLQPGNAETWLNKGIALINLGKAEDACHDFRISLKMGNKQATQYISKYCIK
jgi:Flp pilus assembly protein TadD